MWTKIRREQSKKLETEPLGAKPSDKPKQPDKPKDPSKPPYPYTMTPSESRTYRWRWVEASLENGELTEAVKYAIEVIRAQGVQNVGEFVSEVERELDAMEQRTARYRQLIYARKKPLPFLARA